MNEENKNIIKWTAIGFVIGCIITVLAHPWVNVPIEEVETYLNDNLNYGQVRFEQHWHPLGTDVDIYSRIGQSINQNFTFPEAYLGHFFVDIFGHTEKIETLFGDIPAWW